jgi:hypothetical protein
MTAKLPADWIRHCTLDVCPTWTLLEALALILPDPPNDGSWPNSAHHMLPQSSRLAASAVRFAGGDELPDASRTDRHVDTLPPPDR